MEQEYGDAQFQAAGSGVVEAGFGDYAAPVAAEAPASNGGAPLDDFFSGSAGGAAAPAAVVDDGYAAETLAAVAVEDVVAEVPAVESTRSEEAPAAPAAEDSEPFFSHWEQQAAAPAAPAAPEVEDPRVAWRKQNQEVLKKKNTEESGAKSKLKDTAAAYLKKFYEVRGTTLAQRKSNNRKSEAHQKEVEVPLTGTPWEKVNALVDTKAVHTKDVSRYKAVLIACKAKNVAIKA